MHGWFGEGTLVVKQVSLAIESLYCEKNAKAAVPSELATEKLKRQRDRDRESGRERERKKKRKRDRDRDRGRKRPREKENQRETEKDRNGCGSQDRAPGFAASRLGAWSNVSFTLKPALFLSLTFPFLHSLLSFSSEILPCKRFDTLRGKRVRRRFSLYSHRCYRKCFRAVFGPTPRAGEIQLTKFRFWVLTLPPFRYNHLHLESSNGAIRALSFRSFGA